MQDNVFIPPPLPLLVSSPLTFSILLLSLNISYFPPPSFLLFSLSPFSFSFSSESSIAHVVYMILHGLRFTILSSSWTYNCSPVRHQCSLTKLLLEMLWPASRDLWSSSWFECLGYVSASVHSANCLHIYNYMVILLRNVASFPGLLTIQFLVICSM